MEEPEIISDEQKEYQEYEERRMKKKGFFVLSIIFFSLLIRSFTIYTIQYINSFITSVSEHGSIELFAVLSLLISQIFLFPVILFGIPTTITSFLAKKSTIKAIRILSNIFMYSSIVILAITFLSLVIPFVII